MSFFAQTTRPPLVIAHRGASGQEPENTLRSFDVARKMKADGIELDIMQTKDKKLVVTHDHNTYRMTGVKMVVHESSYRELHKLTLDKQEKIPLLDDVLDLFLDKFSFMNIDVKAPVLFNMGIEECLCQLIKRFKKKEVEQKIIVSSFNPLTLSRFKSIMPKLKRGFLLGSKELFVTRSHTAINWVKPATLNLDQSLYKKNGCRCFFEFPQPKWIWTVNTEDQMKFWIKQRVDAIITDYPDKLRALIKSLFPDTSSHNPILQSLV